MSKTVLYRRGQKGSSTTETTKGTDNYSTQLRNHVRESIPENEVITHLSMKIGWL